MEPQRKWQFAPPLVANFFNLICEKTGAVTVRTMPGGRTEITQVEYQTLKAQYGLTPTAQPQATTPSPAPVVPVGEVPDTEPASEPPEWKARAAKRAAEIVASDRKKDLYPSQTEIADAIAKEFRAAGVVGTGGKPMTGAYIKRHALKGISSEQGKQLSTATRRGK